MKLTIGTARWKHVVLLLGSLAFVAGAVLILVTEHLEPRRGIVALLAGWAGILFFGGCALVGARQLIDSRPRLVIDDDGILDRTLGVGRIPWSDIRGAYLRSLHGNDFVCLDLVDAERYLRRTTAIKRALAGANAALGFTPISLNLSGAAVDAGDVLELILKRFAARE